MYCSDNAFCSSLDAETRKKLCSNCHRLLMKSGSVQIYEDFERQSSLVIDGIVLISGYVDEDVMDYSDDVPTCYLGVPGRVLSTNVTFRNREEKESYGYNSMQYLTDCCVAHFDHSVIRELFFDNATFSQAMMLSALHIMEDGCAMTAILRANSVYLKVYHLIVYLIQQNSYLTQQQISDLINHDRASVSKAVSRIKKEHPSVWETYSINRGRRAVISNPE